MNTSVSSMIDTFNKKIKEIETKSSNIHTKFNDNNFIIDNDKLKLLLNISQNLNLLKDQFDELDDIAIETIDQNNLTSDEKQKIRSNKIEKKINDIFLPYIIYTKICLENNI
jgi:protein subunit release factor A